MALSPAVVRWGPATGENSKAAAGVAAKKIARASSRTISNPSGVESLVLAQLSPDDATRTESWRILRRARRGSGSLARGLGSRGRRRVTLSGEEIAETRAYAESPVTSENGETCGRCDD